MNNRLAMCLVGPVQLVLEELQPQPKLWERLVAQLRRMPEFVDASDRTIILRAQIVHKFTPATACPPFPGAPGRLAAQWAVILTVSDGECLGMLGTQFHTGDHEYEFPPDLPLAQLEPFMPVVDELEIFLGRLRTELKSLACPQRDPSIAPVLNLECLGASRQLITPCLAPPASHHRL